MLSEELINRMKTKVTILILIFGGLFSLVSLGYFLGKTPNNVTEISIVWSWLIDFGTVLAGIGTIVASYVGYLALNNWKSQSKGLSSLSRLLQTQENVAILCCEFLARTTSVMGNEKEELYNLVQRTEYNFAILSRQISPNIEIVAMKKLIFMPRIRIRDSGVLWDPEKKQLRELERQLNQYIKST